MASFNDVMINATAMPTAIDDGSRLTRASDGTPKIARLYGKDIYTFRISFRLLTAAEWLDLLAFYSTNKMDDEIEFTDPNSLVLYHVKMVAPPQITNEYGFHYDAEIELTGEVA